MSPRRHRDEFDVPAPAVPVNADPAETETPAEEPVIDESAAPVAASAIESLKDLLERAGGEWSNVTLTDAGEIIADYIQPYTNAAITLGIGTAFAYSAKEPIDPKQHAIARAADLTPND